MRLLPNENDPAVGGDSDIESILGSRIPDRVLDPDESRLLVGLIGERNPVVLGRYQLEGCIDELLVLARIPALLDLERRSALLDDGSSHLDDNSLLLGCLGCRGRCGCCLLGRGGRRSIDGQIHGGQVPFARLLRSDDTTIGIGVKRLSWKH